MSIGSAEIIDYLQQELAIDVAGIENSTPLFSSGMIDSFALVDLITFLEQQFEIRINAMDVNLDNLDTIDHMLNFATRALAQK